MNSPDQPGERHWKTWRHVIWLVLPLSWLVVGMASRRGDESDGIAYADIALACINGNWHALINRFWSPAYPALLALWLSVFRPSPYYEFTLVRCFICLALIGALCCFEYFMSALLDRSGSFPSLDQNLVPLPRWAIRAVGYGLFFWTTIYLSTPSDHAPDVLVLGCVLLASAIIMRIAGGADGWLRFAALGIVLGFGYLAKAPMFPMAFVFMGVTLLSFRNLRRGLPRLLLTLVCFTLIAGPFVLALSRDKGSPTFGDSGGIDYAIAVNYVDRSVYWQGLPAGSGVPKHPVLKIFEVPPVYESPPPVVGSYPLWYDHAKRYDGVRPHPELRRQLNVLHIGLRKYFDILFVELGGLLTAFLVLLFWGGSFRGFAKAFSGEVVLWGPAIAGLGGYALVHVEDRYLSGFVILLWAACFSALRFSPSVATSATIRSVVQAVLIVLGLQIALSVGHSASQLTSMHDFPDWEVARELKQMGLQPGDKVSYMGYALGDHVWAHLARVSIVSEIPSQGVPDFWAATPDIKSRVLRVFAGTGAKALVTRDVPHTLVSEGWTKVNGTNYYVLQLRQ